MGVREKVIRRLRLLRVRHRCRFRSLDCRHLRKRDRPGEKGLYRYLSSVL